MLKPAPFCTLFAGLGSTNKSAISLLFSYYLTLVLSSPPCPLLHLSSYLKLCGRSGRNCLLSPVLSGYNGPPDTNFYRETTRLMSWPDGKRYLHPPLSLVVYPRLPAAPVDTRPRTLFISFCSAQLRTLCAAHSLATLYLFTTSGPDPGELLGFWGSMVFRHAPIPRKGSGKQQQQ